jgi:hypothetical protein
MPSLEDQAFALLDGVTTEEKTSYALTSKKNYHALVRYQNVTSYSQLLDLHSCPRKLQLKKYAAAREVLTDPEANLHFAFGHSVGAGVQSVLTGADLNVALFQSFLAWSAGFDSRIPKKKKSIWEAGIATEKFYNFFHESMQDWESVILPTGRPAIELSFSLDCGNGYKHYGHIDAVLRSKTTGEIAVIELKTTGMSQAEEAVYANSSQAIGYSIILDALFPGLSSYEVFHFIYSSSNREWTPMPFQKTVSHKTEWIKDLLLDHATMDKYEELSFYPKRGESCFNYFQRCEFFGACNIVPDTALPRLGMDEEAEMVDYALRLEDVIKAQQDKLAINPRA